MPVPPLVATLAAALAATLPSLLAYNPPPSPTLLNQALALACWGLFAAVAAGAWRAGRGAWPLLLALGGVALGVLGSWGLGALPTSLALAPLGLLAAAAVMVAAGASARATASAPALFAAFCWGWVVAGGLNLLIAAVQVFAPDWPDGTWLALSGLPGRAVGNLRQPNHLSSLLMGSALAVVALRQMAQGPTEPGLPPLRPALSTPLFAALFAALMAGVVLTASRTGLVSVLLLAAWGVVDRSLARDVRRLLLAAPLLYGLAWGAMWVWAHTQGGLFGGEARLAATDISSSRFGIWANTLALIARQPWTGVGFGEFNLAWSMTPFPGRPTAFFDHAHNLPLHLLAELGLPLGGAVCALLVWALWRAFWPAHRQPAPLQRCAAMFVLMIGVHSLLEYPLWYAYFLLPTAWVWGFALGRCRTWGADGANRPPKSDSLLGRGQPSGVDSVRRPLLAVVAVLAALVVVADYQRVVRIFEAPANAAPLAQRIAEGRASLLFAHHADYAAATTGLPQPDGLAVFAGASHYLLDTRLMQAWAEALARAGRLDEARWVAARLHEFGPERSGAFFAPCKDPAAAPGAWMCQPPPPLDWCALQQR